MDWQLKEAMRIVEQAKSDNLERAAAAFRGLTAEEMQLEHGQSGKTRAEVVEGYRADNAHIDQIVAYLRALDKED